MPYGCGRTEIARHGTCHDLAHKPYAQSVKHPVERHVPAVFYAFYHFPGRAFACAVLTVYVIHRKFVQIGRVVYKPAVKIVVHRFRSYGIDVHCVVAYKMFYPSLYLWRTRHCVRAIIGSLALITHKRCAAFGAMGYESHFFAPVFARRGVNAHNLRYYLAGFLHVNRVAYV